MAKTLKRLFNFLRTNVKLDSRISKLENELIEIKILCGSIHANINKSNNDPDINAHEFKVFSQFGDDGIIQYLISKIPIVNKTFIEFGVENFFESNTRFLMMKDNWEGFVIDGEKENIDQLINSDFYWKYQLKAESAFITNNNINTLLEKSGFNYDMGIMHIDLDGNDYWIWKEITNFSPRILIIEYNSVFGKDKHWSIPYNPEFQRFKAHYSGLYWGAALSSMVDLGYKKGYIFVGSNSSGNNAYFVRKDINTIAEQNVNKGYRSSKYRESRNIHGQMDFIDIDERLNVIKGLPIFNTLNNRLEKID